MPRGKPFVCWLSSPGHYRDVALHIGDEVEFEVKPGKWVGGKFGTRLGMYVVRVGRRVIGNVFMINSLRPIARKD